MYVLQSDSTLNLMLARPQSYTHWASLKDLTCLRPTWLQPRSNIIQRMGRQLNRLEHLKFRVLIILFVQFENAENVFRRLRKASLGEDRWESSDEVIGDQHMGHTHHYKILLNRDLVFICAMMSYMRNAIFVETSCGSGTRPQSRRLKIWRNSWPCRISYVEDFIKEAVWDLCLSCDKIEQTDRNPWASHQISAFLIADLSIWWPFRLDVKCPSIISQTIISSLMWRLNI